MTTIIIIIITTTQNDKIVMIGTEYIDQKSNRLS